MVVKRKLRTAFLERRELHSPLKKKEKDALILKRLGSFDEFKRAKEFFTYLSHKGEVATDAIVAKFINKKKIVVPRISGKLLHLHELHEKAEFVKGRFGIREPKNCARKAKRGTVDVALIPGIAFDETGHRIGFGGGYFDRFLKKLRCTTIGLAYEFQIIEKVPTHKYDVPVDYIVTEDRIINCRKMRHPELVSVSRIQMLK